ncbi:GNAT family N-acetyltransferase [Saccharicrinis aurantiacus]|uniref:GNAT family N-acetyltransferase n=1 Tax=Saccharicrinis aurantiacus TaxID=1849719 RepID=UPI002493198C|nr:GNAT family N-acetyltransferase [Saccharicrinis aurantiacus]
MKIEIRKAKLSDINNLAVLKQQVWISTYATEGLLDEFSRYVLSEYSVGNVKQSIQNTDSMTLLANYKNCLVGCVEIILLPQRPIKEIEPCIEISTFYILEEFQNKGIGKKLLAECLKSIKGMNFDKIWLTVYYKNQKAIEFYSRQKFSLIGETDFVLGNDKHKNYIMLKQIEK